MSKYNFTDTERDFIDRFFICWHAPCKLVYWQEYGSTEWYYIFADQQFGYYSAQWSRTKVPSKIQKIIKMMLKLGLLIPEIENDKEYEVQRALGCVIGRIYYMPEEIREELKNDGK